MYWNIPANSKRGTILPGGVSLLDFPPAGKGFGRGASGSAKRLREAGTMSPVPVLAGLFSAAALAPSPFCWAHKGKANRAQTATATHQLRMIHLPKLSVTESQPLLSPLRRFVWRCHKFVWTHCGKLSAICHLTADTFPRSSQTPGENPGSDTKRRSKRIPEFPSTASVSFEQTDGQKQLSRPAADTIHCEVILVCRCFAMRKRLALV
jgi:hypothetical protein